MMRKQYHCWPTPLLVSVIYLLGSLSAYCFYHPGGQRAEPGASASAISKANANPHVGKSLTVGGSGSSPNDQHEDANPAYFGYRFYNASTGRWLSRDPLGEEAAMRAISEGAEKQNDWDRVEEYQSASTKPAYLFLQNAAIQAYDWLGLCTVVGPLAPDRGAYFGLGDLKRHKLGKGPPATVIWSLPCGAFMYIVNIEVTSKPTAGSGGERITNGGKSAELSVETRYAMFHSISSALAATSANFTCCCEPR
jgi:hypothetical protein